MATSQDLSSLASGNDDSCGNSSGAKRKTKSSGTVVKSRYMQTEKKPVVKKNTPKESILVPPRPASPKAGSVHKPRFGTPPRRTLHNRSDQSSMSNRCALESSSLDGNVLQSTVLDGHCMRPDFNFSAIEETITPPSLPSSVDLNAKKRNLHLETFLLAFLTAKIEHNTQKLKAEAERNLLILMEEEEKMRSEVANKKRQCLHFEKLQQLNDLLDLQIAALQPVAVTATQFTEEYKTFASAIDTTRHELPIKNFHVEEDKGEFLDKAVVHLNQTQQILELYMKDVSTDSDSTVSCLKEIKSATHEIDRHLLSTTSELLELSSLVSQETVLARQCSEEDQIGITTVQRLFAE